LRGIGLDRVRAHSRALGALLVDELQKIPGLHVLGGKVPPERRVALATASVPVPSMSQDAIARMLADAHAILVSGGYHCAHILHHKLDLAGTLRASAHVFNDEEDVLALARALRDLV
jgi:cysteine desulfurase/selenocysteine lyase